MTMNHTTRYLIISILFAVMSFRVNAELINRYSFSDGSTMAVDSVGGQHGTLVNGATISGNAVHLNGSSQYVNLPAGLITGLDSVTFECWFTHLSNGNWTRVFDFGTTSGSSGRYYAFFTPRSGYSDSRFVITDYGGGSDEEVLSYSTLAYDTPTHIVCVYDGNNNTMRYYLNGALANSRDVTIPLSALNNQLSYLGRSLYSSDPYLRGSIDEFRIYDHALTDAEISYNYSSGPDVMDSEYTATNPVPANNAVSVNPSIQLGWIAPATVPDSYTVYVSERSDLADAQTIEVTIPGCDPDLDSETTYYWRVDTHYGSTTYPGIIWQFTTCISAVNSAPAGDLDHNYEVSMNDLLLLAAFWLDDTDMLSYSEIAAHWLKFMPSLIINEFLAENDEGLTDPDASVDEYDDWIEIYNRSSESRDLSGMYLTDNLDNPTKWKIPGGITVEPYGYVLFWADEQEAQGGTHTNFKLDADGEEIGLFDINGVTLIDSIEFDEQYKNMSYGRFPDNASAWNLFAQPTPGKCNCRGYDGAVQKVEFSRDGGIFSGSADAFDVYLSCDTPDAVIRYTTDFTEPVETSTEYTGPIHIDSTTCLRAKAFKSGWYPAGAISRTYVFLDDVMSQPTNPAGFPSGEVDYQVDPDVVNDPAYASTFKEDLRTIPSFCIVTPNDSLFGSTGIYTNYNSRGDAWERAASIEVIDPVTNHYYQADAGIRISGGVGRGGAKKAFRVIFRGLYGPSKMEYPLFEDSDVHVFDQLILRNTWNYSWFGDSTYCSGIGTASAQYMRELYAHDTIRDMGGLQGYGRHVHVYINGLYWGLYILTERPDEGFAAEHLGGSKDDYDVIKTASESFSGSSAIELLSGERQAWDQLFALAAQDLSNSANYAAIQEYVDIPALIDYMLMVYHTGSRDAPVLLCVDTVPRNFYAIRKRQPGAGFVFLPWDVEWSLENENWDRVRDLDPVYHDYEDGYENPAYLITRLDDNQEFRMLMADHIHKYYFNDGSLTEGNTIARYWSRSMDIDRAIIGESARWGDTLRSTPYTRNIEWVNERNRLVNTYFPARDDVVLSQLRTAGYYPNVDAPVFHINGSYRHGGHIYSSDSLSMIAGEGTVWYTLDGSDPRLAGGAVNTAGALAYSAPFNLTRSTHVKARVLDGATWSALNEAVYAVGPVSGNLRITEIMYHPADPNAEYIELHNIGSEPINPALVSFTNGIEFAFPSFEVQPNGYALVVENLIQFQSKYGTGLNGMIAGEYTGSLENAGERITMTDAAGSVIHNFSYQDTWCEITDGEGFSLTIIDPTAGDPNLWDSKAGWRPSAAPGGSPGSDDSGQTYAPGSVVINEVLSHTDTTPNDWIELHNTTDSPIPVGGWFLSDSDADDPNYMKYRIVDGTYIPAGGYLVITQDNHFGNPSDDGCIKPFALSENGETVYLRSGAGNPTSGYYLTGYFDQEDFGASENGVAFGRYIKSDASVNFAAMSVNTPGMLSGGSPYFQGAANAYPKVGPVIINEIMYNPPAGGAYDHDEYEYVELYNISGSSVVLQEYDNILQTNLPWKFTDGIDYTFPLGISIPAGGKIVVVKNPAAFSERYPSVSGSLIYGPYDGKLDNGGEKLELGKPGDEVEGVRYYIRVDRVNYDDAAPWPVEPDGAGEALHQKTPATAGANYGNDAVNWLANNPSPGL